MPCLLLITSDPEQSAELCRTLEGKGYRVSARPPTIAAPNADLSAFDAIIGDIQAVDQEQLLVGPATVPVIVLGAGGDVRQAVQAMKRGAADYVTSPVDSNALLDALGDVLAPLPQGSEQYSHAPFALIGSSNAIVEVRTRIAQAALADAAVFIAGESGCGLAYLAHAVHAASRRSHAPLISVNCAAIPEPMLEAELFGHGHADNGLVERALGGTLFLEEVGELPLNVQAGLMPLLPDPTGDSALPPSIRIIASSHRDLQQSVTNGQFSSDLFLRLNQFSFNLPPLRERQEDAVEAARELLRHIRRKLGKPPVSFTAEAMQAIRSYQWPGNLRELASAIERAALLCDTETLPAQLLPMETAPHQAPAQPLEEAPSQVSLEDYFVTFVLQHQEHLTETEIADKLGISRKSLWERRQRLNIPRTKTRKRGPRRSA